MSLALACLVAALVSGAMIAGLRGAAQRIGLVDLPGGRKTHVGQVPLVGGLAMFCGFALGALLLDVPLAAYRGFFAACGVLTIVGVLDDLHELSSRSRFAAQILAALFMVWWGRVVLADLGLLGAGGAHFALGAWAVPFTVFSTVGVINAINMSDGLDGLAGGLALIALLGLALVAHLAGLVEQLSILAVLSSVVVAFLAFNVRLPGRAQALAFMGDAGSMVLGFAITWFVISLSQGEGRAMPPVLALWLLMVPLYDTVFLLAYRTLTGRMPTAPDYQHLHHVLQMAGLGVNATLASICALAVLGAGIGIAGWRLGWPEATQFQAFLAGFALYGLLMGVTLRSRRLLGIRLDRRLPPAERRAGEGRRAADRRAGGERREDTERRTGRRRTD